MASKKNPISIQQAQRRHNDGELINWETDQVSHNKIRWRGRSGGGCKDLCPWSLSRVLQALDALARILKELEMGVLLDGKDKLLTTCAYLHR